MIQKHITTALATNFCATCPELGDGPGPLNMKNFSDTAHSDRSGSLHVTRFVEAKHLSAAKGLIRRDTSTGYESSKSVAKIAGACACSTGSGQLWS